MKRVGLKTDPAKAMAWARRSKPLQRVFMAPRSKRKTEQIARELEIRNAYKAAHQTCEMIRFDIPIECWRIATDLHEPWTRAQGGPTDDPRNFAHLCRNCHNAVTFNPDMAQWALDHGFKVHGAHGKRWLEAGGRLTNVPCCGPNGVVIA